MKSTDSAVRLTNASDAIAWKSCRRRAWFDLRETGLGAAPDAFEQLIMHAGMDHEREVLAGLGEYRQATDIANTAELIRARVPVIYQPRFQDDARGVIAQPDFLLLEDAGYRAADAKLARSIHDKPAIRIQLAVYQRVLASKLSTRALLGNGESEFITAKDLLRADEFLADMKILANAARPEAHYGASKCGACPYRMFACPSFGPAAILARTTSLMAGRSPIAGRWRVDSHRPVGEGPGGAAGHSVFQG